MMVRVLLLCTDVVGSAMAGPGVRAWELACVLADEFAVTLAVPGACDVPPRGFTIVPYALGCPGALVELLAVADVVVGQGFVFEQHPEVLASTLPIAIDLYDPLLLEALDLYSHLPSEQAVAQHRAYVALTTAMVRRGDFFFCATETQRDYWLGVLSTLGRVNALTYAGDHDLRRLIDVVPSGMVPQVPVVRHPVLRGVHPAVGAEDLVLLWAGGLWDWFDPLVLVRAVAALQGRCPQLRLCFFAGARPNASGAPFRTRHYALAHALASELGVLDRAVVFLDAWVGYAERGAFLAEADVGVSAHLPGVETRFAFRTRLLDYVWARLPVICSAGDSLGGEIAQAGAGMLVAPCDLDGWVEALQRVCDDGAWRDAARMAAARLAERYGWSEVVGPLRAFCRAPFRAPDAQVVLGAQDRVAELERVLDERERYVRHVEQAYAVERARNPFRRLRALFGRD